ncbi:MAG: pyridoxamine 5'-phosphate oxidase family protein [Deltaproteobacteria bacterium]|nr:MAG: pyridoxamine 5'-phosphate oxidase family protein [Deltaproteobacteria bacterium]
MMVDMNKEVFEIANKPGRIGILATASKQGKPNVAYFGSPRLMEDGTLVMGLGNNQSLKNLEENPKAVFFTIGKSPVTFNTPGYRLYLDVREIQKTGPIIDGVKAKISEFAGAQAAKMIVAGVVFDISDIRTLIETG